MNHTELKELKKARANTIRERVHRYLLAGNGHRSIETIRKALSFPSLEVEEAAVWLVKKDLIEAVELSSIIFYKADMSKAGPMTQTKSKTKTETGIEPYVGKPETKAVDKKRRGWLVKAVEEALDWDLARSRDDIYKMVKSQEISLKQVQHTLHALDLQGRAGAKMVGNVRHYRRTVPIQHWAKKERKPRVKKPVEELELPTVPVNAPIEERMQVLINDIREKRQALADLLGGL
jgi:Fe2+ or Zn2+ uptake regulation protein